MSNLEGLTGSSGFSAEGFKGLLTVHQRQPTKQAALRLGEPTRTMKASTSQAIP